MVLRSGLCVYSYRSEVLFASQSVYFWMTGRLWKWVCIAAPWNWTSKLEMALCTAWGRVSSQTLQNAGKFAGGEATRNSDRSFLLKLPLAFSARTRFLDPIRHVCLFSSIVRILNGFICVFGIPPSQNSPLLAEPLQWMVSMGVCHTYVSEHRQL